ncbi:hypothetical protein AJ78_08412 [Emergomyces pasteurianus Ep9510]|uniref:Aminoglycoside phosphotransferase domain-containing protein n=1 Tax=Emergomyces pasteurianus Ep9510 TaxID=1447872 RepID=A0A1J9Q3W9_9EURO|nr:hypothetical protein AJ78_08412 [Emergomyces pasteurianus Ep9510]
MPHGYNLFRDATFDVHGLCQLASSLHGGRSCACDVTQVPADGSLYWAAFLFQEIGSLFEKSEYLQVHDCLSRALMDFERDSLSELSQESFTSEGEYFNGLVVTGLLQHAECLQLSHHYFFTLCSTHNRYDNDQEYRRACDQWNNFVALESKIDGSNNQINYTVVRDCLRGITSKWAEEMSAPAQNISFKRFSLHHPDLNMNNIFVDDNCSITCIID